jgi:hypothetical protein
MPLVSWSTKIGVGRNHRNKTDFQNLPGVVLPILADGQCIELESVSDAF